MDNNSLHDVKADHLTAPTFYFILFWRDYFILQSKLLWLRFYIIIFDAPTIIGKNSIDFHKICDIVYLLPIYKLQGLELTIFYAIFITDTC